MIEIDSLTRNRECTHHHVMKSITQSIFFFCLAAFVVSAQNEEQKSPIPAPEETPTSSSLTSQAWDALAAKDFATAKAKTERCKSLFGEKASEMQASLSVVPGPDTAKDFWALNDVGTCAFILGKVYEAEGKSTEAITAYQDVIKNYPMSQCWDKQGWYWQPAVAAKERLTALTFDSAK
jgi:tetratricopeptide (TPR) repeat protein